MRHETPENLAAEQEIADAVIAARGLVDAPKLPLCYVLDRVALRESGVVAFLEIKDRDWQFGGGDGLYLSLYKVLNACTLTDATGLPCHLVVRFKDKDVYWCPLDAHGHDGRGKASVFWFGREDRPGENEPCVSFPWSVFRKIEA